VLKNRKTTKYELINKNGKIKCWYFEYRHYETHFYIKIEAIGKPKKIMQNQKHPYLSNI